MEGDIEKIIDLILLKVTFIVQNIIKNILTEGDRVELTNSLKREIEGAGKSMVSIAGKYIIGFEGQHSSK